MKRQRLGFISAVLLALILPASAQASPTTWLVDDDRADCPRADFDSIQAAVAAAAPGDKVLVCAGTYREQVIVRKNDLRLEAKGAAGDVVVEGDGVRFAGLWLQDVSGVLVQGFTVRGQTEASIALERANENTVRKNVTHATGHMGIYLTGSSRNVIEQNVSFDNPLEGIEVVVGSNYNLIRHNRVFENRRWGILIAGPATAPAVGNIVFGNRVKRNTPYGIQAGNRAHGTQILNNRVFGNGEVGIRVRNSEGVFVARNKAFLNPIDISWEPLLFPVAFFENNHCKTSVPVGLCEHTEGAATHEQQATTP